MNAASSSRRRKQARAVVGLLCVYLCAYSCSRKEGFEPLPEPEYVPIDVGAAWSPRDSLIAYSRTCSSSAGPPGIYTIRLDGTGNRLLLDTVAGNLRFSPDGSLLGMRLLGDIYLFEVDSDSLRQLTATTENEASVEWSPDGRSIVTWSSTVSDGGLRIVDVTTGAVRSLTEGAGRVFGAYPRWSPTGEWIAFAAFANDGTQDIHLISPNGDSRHSITDSARDRGRADDPRWLYGGTHVLYSWVKHTGGAHSSRSVRVDGTGDSPWPTYVHYWDAVSPDSRYVVTIGVQPGDERLSGLPVGVLFVRELDDASGATMRQLTSYSPPEG